MFIHTIRCSLEALQIEAGTRGPVLNAKTTQPFEKWTTDTWLHSVKDYLRSFDGEIRLPLQWQPRIQREGDKFIMNMFYKKYKKHKKILSQLKRCRVFLQVLTVADITTSSGTKICSVILQGSKNPGRQSTYRWPLQKAITNKY